MPEPSPSQPIAIVIPWFGRDQRGGAERHAWELASRLRARGHDVEVITTCCRSHQDDWETNHLPPGFSREPEGFAIRRFPVVARNRPAFDEVNARLMGIPKPALLRGASPLRPDEESVFADELIRSPALLEHLWHNGGDYRAFLFIPYLYFTTLRGLPMVADRSILVPCLHHESYAFLSVVSRAFRSSRAILFNSEGERRLASWLYGPAIAAKGTVAGEGIDFDPSIQSDGSVDVGALAPFVLCLGRQDPGKNTDFLCRMYARFRARNPTSRLRLVLAGPGTVPMPDDATGIVNLGPVSEPAKHELLRSCEALFNPSVNESYSRVIMEAWLCGRPVAVHRDCLATALAVQEGKTGWAAGDEGEWIRVLERVDHATQGELARLGEAGRLEAAGAASWDLAIRRYEAAIADLSPPGEQAPPAALGAVHQALPNLAPGDAISNEALAIRRSLRKAGFSSEIYALHVHPDLEGEAIRWQPGCLERDSAVLYHHSIGNALTAEICNHPGPKALIYHNITPHELLADYLPYNSAL
jgi:glycosyltransferase involved in cell wall biosynthesis